MSARNAFRFPKQNVDETELNKGHVYNTSHWKSPDSEIETM